MDRNLVVQTKNLCKSFHGKEVVHNCNMSVEKGSIYGFLGKNGAGKTTIFKMLLGLLNPSMGKIMVLGMDNIKGNLEILRKTGSIIETPIFYEHLSATENLQLHLSYMGIIGVDITKTLEMVGLQNVGNQVVSTYSLGMRQRLAIARAIILLFTYPVKRWKVLLSKIGMVFSYTVSAMILCGIAIYGVFFFTELFFQLSYDELNVRVIFSNLLSLICYSLLAGICGIIALWFGFRKQSVTVNIIAATIISSVMCQIMVETRSYFLSVIIFFIIGLIGSVITLKNMLIKVEKMEV